MFSQRSNEAFIVDYVLVIPMRGCSNSGWSAGEGKVTSGTSSPAQSGSSLQETPYKSDTTVQIPYLAEHYEDLLKYTFPYVRQFPRSSRTEMVAPLSPEANELGSTKSQALDTDLGDLNVPENTEDSNMDGQRSQATPTAPREDGLHRLSQEELLQRNIRIFNDGINGMSKVIEGFFEKVV